MGVKKGFKWDGKTRVSNETYRKNFKEIFNKKEEDSFKKEQDELKESYEQSKKNKKDRNGF